MFPAKFCFISKIKKHPDEKLLKNKRKLQNKYNSKNKRLTNPEKS